MTADCNTKDKDNPLAIENKQLHKQVEELQQRVRELEHHHSIVHQNLVDQMQLLLHPSNAVFHGPDTVEHFNNFSIDSIVSELQTKAPDVVDLFQMLSKCGQTEDEKLDQLRTITSLCTLLKGRSICVVGVQLLLTFMLIARATNKQVN